MGVRVRLRLDGEMVFGPSNDERLIRLLVARYGLAPLEVMLEENEVQSLIDSVFGELQSICKQKRATVDIDDVGAIGWLNSIASLSSLALALPRVQGRGWVLTVS